MKYLNVLELQALINSRLLELEKANERTKLGEHEYHTVFDLHEGLSEEEKEEIPCRWKLQVIVQQKHSDKGIYRSILMSNELLEDSLIEPIKLFILKLDELFRKDME